MMILIKIQMNLKIVLMCNMIADIIAYCNVPSMSIYPNRREVLSYGTSVALLPVSKLNQHVSIIGANGGTGRECARLLAEDGQYVKAISRNPLILDDSRLNKYIEPVQLDIKDRDNVQYLSNHIKGSSAVFFLANAKRNQRYIKSDTDEFQNYEDIDIFGLQAVVASCIMHKVQHLVYVSASCKSCMTDDASQNDKISGIECENCLSKQVGENIIKKCYESNYAQGLGYTIIRIGFLMNGENRGVKELELNQDYTKSGIISRTDLASLCIASTKYPQTKKTTFEAYYRDSTQPYDVKESLSKCTGLGKSVEECFFGSEYKDKKPQSLEELRKKSVKGSLFTTGNEYNGNTWDELFKDLQADKQI